MTADGFNTSQDSVDQVYLYTTPLVSSLTTTATFTLFSHSFVGQRAGNIIEVSASLYMTRSGTEIVRASFLVTPSAGGVAIANSDSFTRWSSPEQRAMNFAFVVPHAGTYLVELQAANEVSQTTSVSSAFARFRKMGSLG